MERFELVNSYLCKDCFDFVENMYFDDNNMGEKERKYIEEKDDVCISTGEYEDENNGYPWQIYQQPKYNENLTVNFQVKLLIFL